MKNQCQAVEGELMFETGRQRGLAYVFLSLGIAIIIISIILVLFYALSLVFPRHRQLRPLLVKGGHGSFNVRSDVRACYTHEGRADTDKKCA